MRQTLLVLAGLLLMACGGPAATPTPTAADGPAPTGIATTTMAPPTSSGDTMMTQSIEIVYRATGGRLPVDLDLHIHPDGQTDLFIGTSYSIPLARVSRVGYFGGIAPSADLTALRSYLTEHTLLDRGGAYGQAMPDTPARSLTIIADGRETKFTLRAISTDQAIDGFEILLQRLALNLTNQPTRAVEAVLNARQENGQIASTITLSSIGSQPLTVMFVDPDQPSGLMRAQVDLDGTIIAPNGVKIPMQLGSAVMPLDAIRALADAGTLPTGITALPLDARYQFELPPIKQPQNASAITATGILRFWLPEGQARRVLTLLTPGVTIP